MPRFGLNQFANRFPTEPDKITLKISGDTRNSIEISDELSALPRIEQTADFHCVTTWSARNQSFSGYRFADFYAQIVQKLAEPEPDANFVVFRCQDGFRAALPLSDLLDPTVLLADTHAGSPLTVKHGAPLRLVAPAHYGYKSPKHLNAIEFWRDDRHFKPPALRFMDHPRARVNTEERGRWFPGVLLRWLYRPLVNSTRKKFKKFLDAKTKKT